MKISYQNKSVLKFYKDMPFNIYSSPETAIRSLKRNNPLTIYPPLKKIIKNNKNFNILDLGCGAGWFANLLSLKFKKVNVTGVDFNPTAIEFAKGIRNKLNLKTNFIIEDLFQVKSNDKLDLITSLGVLHHTDNCLRGIEKIINLSPKYICIGLYHKHGRKPFLNYIKKLKSKYKGLKKENFENHLYEEYKKLDTRNSDELNTKSWFRDQMLHPKETQHTLEEIIPIFKNKYKIISTSLNRFKKIRNLKKVIEDEKKWYDYGSEKLKKNIYFPGFFVTVAVKI